jgi:hypothetical protein
VPLARTVDMKRRSSSPLALAFLVGCASTTYVFTPQGPLRWSNGYPSTTAQVPPEAPQGKVELASFGITDLAPEGAGAISALHVRIAITNEGDATPWQVTTTDQLVEIAGEGRSKPFFVNSDQQTLPTISIGQRQRRVLDLYYPLPSTISDIEQLPAFELLWTVSTPSRPYSSRTRFVRLERDEPEVRAHFVVFSGWGPYWWYDPFYPGVVFRHHRPIVVHRPGGVIVHRSPLHHYRGHNRRDHHRRP